MFTRRPTHHTHTRALQIQNSTLAKFLYIHLISGSRFFSFVIPPLINAEWPVACIRPPPLALPLRLHPLQPHKQTPDRIGSRRRQIRFPRLQLTSSGYLESKSSAVRHRRTPKSTRSSSTVTAARAASGGAAASPSASY